MLAQSGWIPDLTSWRTRHRPMFTDRSRGRCGRWRRSPELFDWSYGSSLSGSCTSLEAGPGRPLPCGTFVIVTPLFWCRVRISEHNLSSLGLCIAIWRVWHSTTPSPIPGMDRRTGVGWSVGDVSGEVATFVDSGPGYGCCIGMFV